MEPDLDLPFLIVTGSSAGGIDALISFVSGLPPDFAAPIVIAQHLDPANVSRLPAILTSRTALKVKTAGELEPLERGVVYVAPPNRDVIVDGDGKTIAATFIAARRGPKPSIDRLFKSAAERFGDRLIAVVFSGMGHDGLAGARIVKDLGGMVAVQDPATAAHPSMPLAIPPALVDIMGSPTQLAEAIVEITGTTSPGVGHADQALLAGLLERLRERSGVDFAEYKPATITRRLARLMAASGVRTLADYIVHLETNPEEYARLLSAFLIKVTEFFRDAELFDELRTTVLPRLIEDASKGSNELRIWSAGASTGEEAYSLAILCAELLSEGNESPNPLDAISVRIFATDIDDEAIAFARRGLYPAEALRHVPQAWIDRYFVRSGDGYEVSKPIRNMTVFGKHDLGKRAPFPRIDLCACRNVLIYFTRELQLRALQIFAFSLRSGGVLVLGKAESATALPEYFGPMHSSLKIFSRIGDRIIIPPTRMREPLAVDMRSLAPAGISAAAGTLGRGSEGRPSLNELFGAFVATSMLGIIVVDRQYDIVALNEAARSLAEIHGVGVGNDLIHLVRPSASAALREIIDAAFLGETLPATAVAIGADDHPSERWISVLCAPVRARGASPDTIALMLWDITGPESERRDSARENGELRAALAESNRRIEELTGRHRALLRANDELRASNAALAATNEELLITVEEASSANEEIETLNEEMQATNEELETLNEELQATVEELNTTNDEIAARGTVLERAAISNGSSLLAAHAERAAFVAALEDAGLLIAAYRPDGQLAFASPALAAALHDAPAPEPAADEYVLDGRRYHLRRLERASDGRGFDIFRFSLMAAT
jgi:two-component system CheB/CheR fusion protein